MRPLAELKRKSSEALKFRDLIAVAAYSKYPSTAYQAAVELGWYEGKAASCRFLAIILRDYGINAFKNVVSQQNQKAFQSLCFCDCHLQAFELSLFLDAEGYGSECDCQCCNHGECFHAAHTFHFECDVCGRDFDENEAEDENVCENCDGDPDCNCFNCDGDACDSCDVVYGNDCVDCKCDGCEEPNCNACKCYDCCFGSQEESRGEERADEEGQTICAPETRVESISRKLQQITGTNYPAEIISCNEINAFTDGKRIMITSAALNAYNDNEIANALGHEIAHNETNSLEARKQRIEENVDNVMEAVKETKGIFKKVLVGIAASGLSVVKESLIRQQEEYQADERGQQIAEQAGFDPEGAVTALNKGYRHPGGLLSTHPSDISRKRRLTK